MKFSQTVLSDKLRKEDPDMYEYWNIISEWVDWFSKSYLKIKDTYNHAKEWKMSDNEIKVILMDKYEIDGKLANFLIKSF